MTIAGIDSSSAINAASTQQVIPKKASSGEITDDYTVSDESKKFNNIVDKYDITNMSRNEMNEMAQDLYDNGFISLKQLGFLTLDPSRIEGVTGSDITISGWKVSTDPNKKMNFLEGLKAQADFNKMYGDSKYQDSYDMMVELAEKIHYFQHS